MLPIIQMDIVTHWEHFYHFDLEQALQSSCELLRQIVMELNRPACMLLASLCNCMQALLNIM